jgi:polar amino acid transport system substrate-binding protein
MLSMRLLCALPLIAMLQIPAWAAAPTVLKVMAQEGTEPKYIPAGIGRVVGMCVDLYRAIERIDPSLRFQGDQQWTPALQALSQLASHEHDALCAVQRTDQRARDQLVAQLEQRRLQEYVLARAPATRR